MNKISELSTYVLPTGESDRERLSLLNEVYGQYSRASFDKINLKKGERVAIFGCGSGECIDYIHEKIGDEGKLLCIDISPEQIDLTKKVLTEKGILNVEYKIADIHEIKGDESYDLAYCRFVLIHLTNPRKAIENMLSFVKRGKFIACDEYTGSIKYCYPQLEAFKRIIEVTKKIRETLKKDNTYGEKLYHEMLNFDVECINFEFNMPISNLPRKKQLIIMTWEAIKKNGSLRDVVAEEELDFIITELKKYQYDTTNYQTSGAIFQYIGRKR